MSSLRPDHSAEIDTLEKQQLHVQQIRSQYSNKELFKHPYEKNLLLLMIGLAIICIILAPFLTVALAMYIDITIASAMSSFLVAATTVIVQFYIQDRQWNISLRRDNINELRKQKESLEQIRNFYSRLESQLKHAIPLSNSVTSDSSTKQQAWLNGRNDLLAKLGKLSAIGGVSEEFASLAEKLYVYDGTLSYLGSGPPKCPEDISKSVEKFKNSVNSALSDVESELAELTDEP